MDFLRKRYANEIRLNMSRIEIAQKRDEETLKNLYKLNISPEIIKKKKAELTIAMEKRQDELFSLGQRERDFLEGRLDQEINSEIKKNSSDAKVRNDIAVKKKTFSSKEKVDDEKRVREVDYQSKSEDRNLRKDYGFYYRLYCKADETLPDYIRTNLVDMPNNKGYIWRDCWFMGDKPAEQNQPMIMFEKKRGGIMHIHEIDSYEHKIFEKNGKEKKKLISSSPRKINSSHR